MANPDRCHNTCVIRPCKPCSVAGAQYWDPTHTSRKVLYNACSVAVLSARMLMLCSSAQWWAAPRMRSTPGSRGLAHPRDCERATATATQAGIGTCPCDGIRRPAGTLRVRQSGGSPSPIVAPRGEGLGRRRRRRRRHGGPLGPGPLDVRYRGRHPPYLARRTGRVHPTVLVVQWVRRNDPSFRVQRQRWGGR
jgi:hypothetical protein